MTLQPHTLETGPEQFGSFEMDAERTSAIGRIRNFAQSAFSATVDKLVTPFESMPTVNKRVAIFSAAGSIGTASAVGTESASGHLAEGRVAPIVRQHDRMSSVVETSEPVERSTKMAQTSNTKFYEYGDRRADSLITRRMRDCIAQSGRIVDPQVSKDRPTGKWVTKWGTSWIEKGDRPVLHIKPKKGFEPCLVYVITQDEERYFPSKAKIASTTKGYTYTDPYRKSKSGHSMRAAGVMYGIK